MTISPRTLLMLLVLAAPLAAQADAVRYAIVIGNDAAPADDPTLSALSFADDDAARYVELLDRVSARSWILSVLDDRTQRRYPATARRAQPPTREAVFRAVDALAAQLADDRRAGRDTTVYFAFSGHGRFGADGEAELVLLDGGLSRRELFDRVLARWDADRVHLLIDACNAGAMVGSRGAFDRALSAQTSTLAPADLSRILAGPSLARFPHVGAVIAASAGQETHEWSRVESGVFTHELLSGLLGAADVNGDQVVEYSEIEAFVSAANSRIEDPRARPAIRALAPSLDRRTPLFAHAWVEGGPRLTGRAQGLGRFFLERANGQRYADAHLDAQATFALLLPPDEPVFLRGDDFEIEVPPRSSGDIELASLARRAIAFAARGSLDVTFRQSLFAAPYGPTYYRGFTDSRDGVSVPLDQLTRIDLDPRGGWTRQDTAITLWAGAGAVAIAGVVAVVAASHTRAAFDATQLEVEAQSLARQYDLLLGAAIAAFASSAAAASTGTFLWLSVTPEAQSGPGPARVSLGLSINLP